MLDIIPKEIKNIFIIVFIVGILAFFLGLIFSNEYLYIAYTLGVMTSIVSNSFMLYISYKVAYKDAPRSKMVHRYIAFYIIYALVMYLVTRIINDKYAILFTALGLLSFRLSIYFYYLIKKILRKWGVRKVC